jgi:peptidoglycan hydrolase CwlO-like protein
MADEWKVYKMDPVVLVALIGAVPGVIALVLQFRKNRTEEKKGNADVSLTITESALKLVEPLNKEIDKLKIQVTNLEKKIEHQDEMIHRYNVGTKKLLKQLCDNNMKPVWIPVFVEEK